MVVALAVMFGSLLMLLSVAMVALSDAALARQRHSADAIANQVIEQVRALPYETVGQGLDDSTLATDPNIVTCLDSFKYFKTCPATNPNSEKIVHTAGLANITPLVPNTQTFAPPTYPNTFTVRAYVTSAVGVPSSGAYRVTAIVSWNATVRKGAVTPVQAETLVYKAGSTTDPSTGSGAFFFGTGDLSSGAVKLAPISGVTGGTGVTGLSAWDWAAQELANLSSSITAQTLTKVDSKVGLDGARKSVSATVTEAAGDNLAANADDDPGTAITTSDTPAPISMPAASVSLSGGGNSLTAGATAASGPVCPGTKPSSVWITGMEHGIAGGASDIFSGVSGAVGDSTVDRTGLWSLKVTKTTTTPIYAYIITGGFRVVSHFAVRLASLPTGDGTIAVDDSTVGQDLFLKYQASTQKFLVQWGTGTSALSSSTVSAGTWYSFDLRTDRSTTTFVADWRINGSAQTSISSVETTSGASRFYFGSPAVVSEVFTANYDDMMLSLTPADYPLPDISVMPLSPTSMGTNVGATNFQNNDATAINASSYTRVDDTNMFGSTDWVKQTVSSATSYLEFNYADTVETCIMAVRATVGIGRNGTQTDNAKVNLMDGATERIIFQGDMPCGNCIGERSLLLPVASATQSAVNAMKSRFGYSTDINPTPFLSALLLELAVIPGGGAGGGPPGNQNGSGFATTPPTVPTVCYASQVSGACSYTRTSFYTPAPTLQTIVNIAGSGGGDCILYQRTPDTLFSSAYGRRDTTLNATGFIVDDVAHYYGKHEIGGLCAGTVNTPAGWPGFLVKYDATGLQSSVKAAAGIQAPYPRFSTIGTITYWNGSGTSTMTPPAAGGSIPVANFSVYTSNGWRYDITSDLATSPSFITQTPANAPLSGTADRTEAKAVLGAPVTGTITYKLTNTGTGNVVINLTINVDLGSLTAQAVYKA
jgi:hypothetical protein